MLAVEADLIPVVDAGRSLKGQLEQHCQLHQLLITAAQRQQPDGIVAAQQIERRLGDLLREAGQLGVDALGKLNGVGASSGEEIKQDVGERVIHHGVELVALKPRHCIMHNFPEQVGVRVHLLNLAAELAPKLAVHLIGHVQPPAIQSQLANPISADLQQIGLDLFIARVQLRHNRLEAEGGIVRDAVLHHERPLFDMEPVGIAGGRAVLLHIYKGRKRVPAMVEYAVQQYPNAPGVTGVDQFLQLFVRAEMRVDKHIIACVIFVIGCRSEQRIEINRVDSQLSQIVQMVKHPLQIAAKKIGRTWHAAPFQHSLRVDRRVTLGEALGEDLVEDRFLDPFRRGVNILGVQIREIEQPFILNRRRRIEEALFQKIDSLARFLMEGEIIDDPLKSRRDGGLPVIEQGV
ncbi:hypothetical protein D3C77_266730 [compost metagenome]